MLHTKYQAPEPFSYGEEFLVYFIFEPKTPAAGPFFLPEGHHLHKFEQMIMQCYIPNFKHMTQVLIEKIFEYFLCSSIVSTQEPLGRDHFGPGTTI